MLAVFDIGSVTVVSTRFMLIWSVLVAALWALLLLRHRKHQPKRSRRHRIRGIATVCIAAALSLALAADGVNSYFSYLPNVSDVVDALTQTTPPPLRSVMRPTRAAVPASGKLATLTVPKSPGFEMTQAWVWLPPQYFTEHQRRFPVVYLFHGSPGVQKDWFHGGEAARTGAELARAGWPAILIAPQMSRNWLDDTECVDGIHERVETHLLQAVIPAVDSSLRSIANRRGRVFAGMSAGGFCALNLGLRNRSEVSTILDFSGLTSPTHTGGMRALFGSNPQHATAANDPAAYARLLTTGPAMRIWLDTGTSDHQVKHQITALARTLQADHMNVQLHSRPGNHTYSVWRPALTQSLTWALPALTQP